MRTRLLAAALTLLLAPGASAAEDGPVVPPGLFDLAGDVEYGAYLSGECTGCHQLQASDGLPPLQGLEREEFILAMLEYRQKLRDNATMQLVAGRLSDEEIAALAAYFRAPE